MKLTRTTPFQLFQVFQSFIIKYFRIRNADQLPIILETLWPITARQRFADPPGGDSEKIYETVRIKGKMGENLELNGLCLLRSWSCQGRLFMLYSPPASGKPLRGIHHITPYSVDIVV